MRVVRSTLDSETFERIRTMIADVGLLVVVKKCNGLNYERRRILLHQMCAAKPGRLLLFSIREL
jgi:hypothetical protein